LIFGVKTTVLVTVFRLLIEVEHKPVAVAPEAIFVTVIVVDPAAVSPLAVNVPVPAVPTVIAAVRPVCDGELVLYVTV